MHQRVCIDLLVATLTSWLILTLVGCHSTPQAQHPKGEGEGTDSVITITTTPQAFFLPLDRFGERFSSAELDDWAQSVGGILLSSADSMRIYSLPTDTLSEMTLYTPQGIYRELRLSVPAHPFVAERAFYRFLSQAGFTQSLSYPYLWFAPERTLWLEYYPDEVARQDIHYYAGADLESFVLPFTQLRQDISRQAVRDQLATLGYVYNEEKSHAYQLTFDDPDGEWVRVIVFYDQTSEQPIQVQMLPRNRYVLRSPSIQKYLESEGFYIDPERNNYESFSYLHDKLQLRVELTLTDIPSEAKIPGGLIISYHADPNAPVELESIDFPSFQWGASQEELEAYEKQRGRMPQMFMNVLNVDTGDPNFTHHAYFFDESGLYNRSETLISRQAVVESKTFVRLMRDEGFDYGGEQSGKITYFNEFDHIVAIIDLTAPTVSITYLPL